jgi:hypothetical protein
MSENNSNISLKITDFFNKNYGLITGTYKLIPVIHLNKKMQSNFVIIRQQTPFKQMFKG